MSDMTRSGHRQFIEAGERKYQERRNMANFLDDYAPVEDRLRAFWKDHPAGRVMTTLVSQTDGDFIVYAEVWRSEGDLPAASGLAHDSVDELPPNMKASALEVCETSAIGRALANLGYAAKGKRPSREEMLKASPVAAERGKALGQDPGDISPAAPGEVAVAPEPGEDSAKASPGSTTYPMSPEDCDHKFASGGWLKTRQVEGVPICPRCGMSAVLYRESA